MELITDADIIGMKRAGRAMTKTLSSEVYDASATRHKLLSAQKFLRSERWREDDLKLRVLNAIVKIWDEGGGDFNTEVLQDRFGIKIVGEQLDGAIDDLVRAGLLERLNENTQKEDESDEIGVSAKGLNLASELSWRRSTLRRSAEW